MHLLMCLVNDILDQTKLEARQLDSTELGNNEREKETDEKIEKMKELEEEKEMLGIELSNAAIVSNTFFSDIKRLEQLLTGNTKQAENIANNEYTKKSKRTIKKNCDSLRCVIFPCDSLANYDQTIKCCNGCILHVRCEGIIIYSLDDPLPENYKCIICKGGSEFTIRQKLKEGEEEVDKDISDIKIEHQVLENKIKLLENNLNENMGPREMRLMLSYKNLKVTAALYHGGSLEGRQCQKILEDIKRGNLEILNCFQDKLEIVEKYKVPLQCLANVCHKLRIENDNFTDEEVAYIKQECEQWSNTWPVNFPHRNITPKGHIFSFVLPKFIEKHRTYHMYYRMEQAGEKMHATLNEISRKLWAIRNVHDRLWLFICM
jgi:hypothetical protein